jgi:asparagine synthetase B (glutamine-hydrolysing)
VSLDHWPEGDAPRREALRSFVFDTCKAQANWNMDNFIADQIELIKKQVGNKKVLLALSGGVDSSVVAALLIRAICSYGFRFVLTLSFIDEVCLDLVLITVDFLTVLFVR